MERDRGDFIAEISVPLPTDYTPGTLVDLFIHGASLSPGGSMYSRMPDGSWEETPRERVAQRVRHVALGLQALGFERGQRVGILSNTRLEWAVCDYGALMSGVVVVTIYPTLPADQVAFILNDSQTVALFAEDRRQVDKVLSAAADLPHLRLIVVFDPGATDTAASGAGQPANGIGHPANAVGHPTNGVGTAARISVLSLSELEQKGAAEEESLRGSDGPEAFETRARQARPEDLATLIYTSGTTGTPKGVMLSHANLHSNAVLSARVLALGPQDRALSWLPLCHAFERTAGHFLFWYVGAEIAYAASTRTVARDMREARPTAVIAPPRLYEKVYEAVEEAAEAKGLAGRLLFRWTRRVGESVALRHQDGRRIGPLLAVARRLVDRLVFAQLRARTGGRVRVFVSGAAPLSPAMARFFFSAGLPVIEGYGLTETSPVLCVNHVEEIRFGTVGPPIPGTEIRIAEDGEIMARGPQVMMGYYGSEEKTRQVLSSDGWLSTGDIGDIDAEGYLRITDRKKNLIVTAAGKNIAPQPIEEVIARSPNVDQVVMLGDRRQFPIVLIVPSAQAYRAAFPGREVTQDSRRTLAESSELGVFLETDMRTRVAGLARFERPKRVLVVFEPFTVENGLLTPTLKVKRREILRVYEKAIEEFYERAERELEALEALEAREPNHEPARAG